MPRRARSYIAGLPYHIVQRGNNKEPCFIQPSDYQFYLELWKECSKLYAVSIHAYCLMTNHIHFVVTPENETGISTTMKVVGSRYAFHINRTYSRTGTLWEGRHRSSLIDTDRSLLLCYQYVEMNPVRAGMVKRPEEYAWSSYGRNGCGDKSWLQPHDEYLNLGTNQQERCENYRNLFVNELGHNDLLLIRKAAHYNQPVGDDRFRREIEEKYGLKPGYSARGRPRKSLA